MQQAEPLETPSIEDGGEDAPYVLDAQIGFVLRQAQQRHTAIFARKMIEDVTPTQWAALAKLAELGPCSQNLLGRHTAMDAATIKGVVDRLATRGLIGTTTDPDDNRRLLVALTDQGRALVARATPVAHAITDETLSPLAPGERRTLLRLIAKMR